MTVESETLAEAARRFGEVIQAERTATLTALEAERAVAIKIIAALRKENDRRSRASGGKFVLGFLIGTAIGVAAVSVIVPKSGEERRASLALNLGTARANLSGRLRKAVEAGKRAAAAAEQDLWAEYRQRIAAAGGR
ncbi:MAG: YtxH domain-containing protein [Chloroflexales bacterium]